MKKELAEILENYPSVSVVFVTSDGLLHLSNLSAQAQARHLVDRKVKRIDVKAGKVLGDE